MNNSYYKIGNSLRHLSLLGVIGRLLGIVNLYILLNFLTIIDYGIFALINSTLVLVTVFSGLSLDEVIASRSVKALSMHKNRKGNELLSSFFRLNFFGSILATIPILGLLQFGNIESTIQPKDLLIIFFIILLMPIRRLILLFYQVQEQFAEIKRLELLQGILKTVGYFSFIYLFDSGLFGALCAILISLLFSIICLGRMFFVEYLYALRFTTLQPVFSLLLEEGKWALARGAVSTGHESLRAWLFMIILGTEALAFFSAAKSLCGTVKSLLPLKRVLLPLMSRKLIEDGQLKEIFSQAIRLTFSIMFVVAAGIILSIPWLVPIFIPKYQSAILIFQIMALSLPFGGGGVLTVLFILFDRNKMLLNMALLRVIFMLFLMLPAMYLFGLIGGIVAFLINGLLITIILYTYLRQKNPTYSLHAGDIFLFKHEDLMLIKGFFNKKLD